PALSTYRGSRGHTRRVWSASRTSMGFTAGRVHYAPRRERPKARSSRKRDPRRLGARLRWAALAGWRRGAATRPNLAERHAGGWHTPHRLLPVHGPAFLPPPSSPPRPWPPFIAPPPPPRPPPRLPLPPTPPPAP